MSSKFFAVLSVSSLFMTGVAAATPFKWWKEDHQANNAIPVNTLTHAKTQQVMEVPRIGEEYAWNDPNGMWYTYYDRAYRYNEYGNLSEDIAIIDGTIDSSYKMVYAYDAQGRQTAEDEYVYKNGGWELSLGDHTSYTLDAQGRLTVEENESYISTDGFWTKEDKATYSYDASGNMAEILYQDWYNSMWLNTERITFNNGTSGLEMSLEEWKSGAWQTRTKYIDVVWSNNRMEPISYTSLRWNGSDWVSDKKYTITYEPNGAYVALTQSWGGSTWINYMRKTRQVDSHGNETDDNSEAWAGASWATYNRKISSYTYSGNKMTQKIERLWDVATKKMVNRWRYLYSDFTTISVTSSINEKIDKGTYLYPNPVEQLLNIKIDDAYHIAAITDFSGRMIMTQQIQPNSTTLRFDLSNLQSGIYLLQLQGNGTSAVQKIVKK